MTDKQQEITLHN